MTDWKHPPLRCRHCGCWGDPRLGLPGPPCSEASERHDWVRSRSLSSFPNRPTRADGGTDGD